MPTSAEAFAFFGVSLGSSNDDDWWATLERLAPLALGADREGVAFGVDQTFSAMCDLEFEILDKLNDHERKFLGDDEATRLVVVAVFSFSYTSGGTHEVFLVLKSHFTSLYSSSEDWADPQPQCATLRPVPHDAAVAAFDRARTTLGFSTASKPGYRLVLSMRE